MSKKNTEDGHTESTDDSKKDEDLQAAIAELDTFFYRASHDLRTPIVALEGIYNMLNSNKEFIGNPALGLLKKQVTKIKGLNESIIDIGTARSKSINIEPVNLLDTTERICRELDLQNAVQVDLQIPKDIYLNTDPVLLETILKSLIHNTINYRDGAKKAQAKISTQEKNGNLIWSIQDNGIGINEHLLPKLFTMFFRANVQQTGFGLSLYKSKIAAQRLNFILEIDSVEFEGTKASILFREFFQSI